MDEPPLRALTVALVEVGVTEVLVATPAIEQAAGGSHGKGLSEKIKEAMVLYRDVFRTPEKAHFELGRWIW